MMPSSTSFIAHMTMEYIKSLGFWLETDEVEDMGAVAIVQDIYGLQPCLSRQEWAGLESELFALAEANEIREAEVKRREREIEERGTFFFRQASDGVEETMTVYPMEYSYPVDENLRQTRSQPGPSFSPMQKKPLQRLGHEVNKHEKRDNHPVGR